MMTMFTVVMDEEEMLALGRALYLADSTSLRTKGLRICECEEVQNVFDTIDTLLTRRFGPGWLGELEDEMAEEAA